MEGSGRGAPSSYDVRMCVCAYVCCMYVVFLLWGDVYCASGERKAQERKYVSMFVVCLSVVCLSVFCILYSVCMHVRPYYFQALETLCETAPTDSDRVAAAVSLASPLLEKWHGAAGEREQGAQHHSVSMAAASTIRAAQVRSADNSARRASGSCKGCGRRC